MFAHAVISLGIMVFAPVGAGRDIPVPTSVSYAADWDRVHFSHDLWSKALSDHVDESGLVNYAKLGRDPRFLQYLHRLANTGPASLVGTDARLAFWLNAYNALAIQGVLETFPKDRSKWSSTSVLDVRVPGIEEKGKGFFRGLRFVVGGRPYTLDEIEKAVILRYPDWVSKDSKHYDSVGPSRADPRAHFALVCCARGCPPLRRTAYTAAGLDAQLAESVKRFLSNESRARFDVVGRKLYVSSLLDWYGGDLVNPRMTPHAPSVPAFLAGYVADNRLARSLSAEAWAVSYLAYNWKLNTQ